MFNRIMIIKEMQKQQSDNKLTDSKRIYEKSNITGLIPFGVCNFQTHFKDTGLP